ncbi:MAG: helix-turn-helix transcriptional regulator [Chitinispirillaceae bacterium]|nr:helix-turn-helix transcriptional regulator [Chitinispirillaceae bacterium]
MFSGRHVLTNRFKNDDFQQHPDHPNVIRTLPYLHRLNELPVLELPSMRVEVLGVDYLELSGGAEDAPPYPLLLHFQQDCFRLWFQVEGNGILQNLSQNIFGTAKPGLLGVMERSRRYSYLHQKGPFECFQLLFSLLPSPHAKCYWNSDIQGKCVLDGETRRSFERLAGDLLLFLADRGAAGDLSAAARLFDIFAVLFAQKILSVEETQFPKNKAKSLVKKAASYMELHYARIRHQNELEQECGVDINYLNIVFKKETGGTLYEYLTRLRMEQAKHLLATTIDPVTDIAAMTGYPNNNSFSRAFKRCEACTPLEFRSKSRDLSLKHHVVHSSTETT